MARAFNRTRRPKGPSSGVVGVTWDRERKKWHTKVFYEGEQISFGRFENKQDAIDAVEEFRSHNKPRKVSK